LAKPFPRHCSDESPSIGFSAERQIEYVERLIGTLRRDCLDHVLIFHERHLRQVLTLYSLDYNETRTHLGFGQGRAVQRSGTIVAIPILSGLHSSIRTDVIFGKGRSFSHRRQPCW